MDYEFRSLKELFERVRPALNARKVELQRVGYQYISSLDIWNCLIEYKWKNGKNLMLSDIVDDIMQIDIQRLDAYLDKRHSDLEDNNIER